MKDWKKWFEDCPFTAEAGDKPNTIMGLRVENMYQAFKSRLIDELGMSYKKTETEPFESMVKKDQEMQRQINKKITEEIERELGDKK